MQPGAKVPRELRSPYFDAAKVNNERERHYSSNQGKQHVQHVNMPVTRTRL